MVPLGIDMVPLGIDKEKLMLQLEKLEENLIHLKQLQAKLKTDDPFLFPAAERLLQISTESCLNIGNHIISGLGLKRADTYKEIFIRLMEEGIISKEIGNTMADFTYFRNRLVHLYWEVTKEEVASKLGEIDNFKRSSKEVIEFLEKKLNF